MEQETRWSNLGDKEEYYNFLDRTDEKEDSNGGCHCQQIGKIEPVRYTANISPVIPFPSIWRNKAITYLLEIQKLNKAILRLRSSRNKWRERAECLERALIKATTGE